MAHKREIVVSMIVENLIINSMLNTKEEEILDHKWKKTFNTREEEILETR